VRKRHHALAKKEPPTVAEAIENVLIKGDLAELTPEHRLEYYKALCKSLGLNPLTRPFEYILFREKRDDEEDGQQQAGGRLTLYANKSCAEQLRQIHKVAVIPGSKKRVVTEEFATTDLAVVDKIGRTDTATGIVYLFKGFKKNGVYQKYRLTGQNLGNAIMKSETKAKRRATLSICGLSMLDETEIDSVDVIGGVTKDGRIWQYEQLPEQASPHPDADAAIASLRARGLWCDEHNCARSAKHNEICLPAKTTAPPSPQQAPDNKPAAPSGAQSSEPPQSWKQPPEKPLPVDNAVKLPTVGEITIDWKMNSKAPVLTGQLEEFGVLQAKHDPPIKLDFGEDGFWHATPAQVPVIKKLAAENRFAVVEILPDKVPPAGQKATQPAARKATEGSSAKPGQPPSTPSVVSGTIERVNMATVGKSPVKMITLVLADGKKQMVGCFHKSLWDEIEKGLGKFASFRVDIKGIYMNIAKCGLIKIGTQEWDETGMKAVQRKDVEAGQRTLH